MIQFKNSLILAITFCSLFSVAYGQSSTHRYRTVLQSPTEEADWSIQSSSVLIDAGLSSYNTQPKDVAGNIRIIGKSIDIGAYEYQHDVSVPTNKSDRFSFYPNPASEQIFFSETVDVQIYSLKGEKLLSAFGVDQMQVSSLPAGIYLLSLTGGKVQQSFHICISNR